MGSPLDNDVPSEPLPPSRRALNQELHAQSAEARPIESRGVAGHGAQRIAQNINRAQQYAPTQGRAFAAVAYERGAAGELFVAEALKWLPGDRFVVLHDQPWPGRPKANIDHIVVGPNGIFVVDAKNWSGKLATTSSGLTQNGQDRTNAITECAAQATAVTTLVRKLPIPSVWGAQAHPILAFVSDSVTEQAVMGVDVVRAKNLAAHIGPRPEIFDPADVSSIASQLEEALRLDRQKAREAHARNRSAYVARQRVRAQNQPIDRKATRPAPRPQTKSKPLSKREERKRAKTRGDFAKFLVVAAALAVIAYNPGLITSLAETIGSWLSAVFVDGPAQE